MEIIWGGEEEKLPELSLLDDAEMRQLCDDLPHICSIVEHRHGQTIEVPWLHSVYNMAPCMKIAFDFLEED